MSTIFVLICVVSAILSFRYVAFGICFILLTRCVVSIPMIFSQVNIGIGVITGTDIVILALFMRVVFSLYKKEIKLSYVLPLILLMFFIFLGATYAFLFDHRSMVAFYRSFIGIGCYYSICLSVLLLSEKEAKYVLNFAIVTALTGIGVQSYLIYTQNIELLTLLNPFYQQADNEELLQFALDQGNMPRVLPSGTLLIAMCSGYTLVKSLTSQRMFLAIWFAILYLILTLFLLSTGTRSFIVVSIIVFIYAVYSIRNIITQSRKLLFTLLLPLGLVLIGIVVMSTSIFDTLIERSTVLQNESYHDEGLESRIHQALDALVIIASSPLGIGVTRPLNLAADAGMWDTNGFVLMGFLGGVPAMICIAWFLLRLYKQYKKKSASVEVLACGAALLYALILAIFALSFGSSFSETIIAFSLFAGNILRNWQRPPFDSLLQDKENFGMA